MAGPGADSIVRKIIPVVATGAAALTLAGATFAVAATTKDVQLTVDGASRDVTTMAATVGEVLQNQGIEVGQHDVVVPASDTRLADGTAIAVQYGRRVTVTVDGRPQTFWTTATTVEQALAAHQVDVDDDDRVSTSRSAAIGRDGLAITVATRTTVTKTKTSRIAFKTTYKKSARLDRGQTKVDRQGVTGTRTTEYTEVWQRDKLLSRTTTGSAVTKQPKNKVVLRGTREVKSVLDGGAPAAVGDGGGERSQVFTTGYTYWDNTPPGSAEIARPQIHDRAGGTGTWKDPITVAVQAGRFPFGTRFYLPELKKYFIVEDLCGACHDGRGGGAYTLDLWIDGRDLSSSGADQCASRVTGVQPAVKDPDADLPVATGPVC